MSIFGESLLLKIKSVLESREADNDTVSEISYIFDRPDINVLNSVQILGTVIITLNGKAKTQGIEKVLLSKEVEEKIIDVQGSKSIKEDIEGAFVRLIDKKTKNPKHSKKKPETKAVNTPIRSVTGRFYNIANLSTILNEKLPEQIRKNMGKGSAKSILNYRSGRFANSARIKQLVRTREGHIEAFYTYMKYPYQTFEPGFKQGEPKSRDPRILISKSIREIATDIVINRLKATRI